MKHGRIKFADADRGYGYIIPDDADDGSDTVLFDLSDLPEGDLSEMSIALESLVAGAKVAFEVEGEGPKRRARAVRAEP